MTAWSQIRTKHIGEISFDYLAISSDYKREADNYKLASPKFNRLQFEAAIARTLVLSTAPPALERALSVSAGAVLSALFHDAPDELAITYDIEQLADHGRSSFAGDLACCRFCGRAVKLVPPSARTQSD